MLIYSLTIIEDAELIEKVNYLIRSNVANLNEENKQTYEVIRNHRYGNLKELLKDAYSLDSEMYKDLTNYLEVLNPKKEEPKNLRKRKKNQK